MTNGDGLPAWRRYLRFWRANAAGDVRDELSFHLASAIDELVAAGMSRDEARTLAVARFGDVGRISRTLYTLSEQRERGMARGEWWHTLKQDLVFGIRQLRKSPGFTLVAVLTLALGIGANSAIFSVVYSVLLKPLPYADGDRVLRLKQRNGQGSMCCLPYGNFFKWARETSGFEALGATTGHPAMTLAGQGEPRPVSVTLASAGYWRTMFIPPALGRYFTDDEDREGAPKVVVISHALWESRFNGDRGVLGRTINLEGESYEVVGVAPPEYILYPPAEKIWLPLAPPAWRLNDFGDHELSVYGLLRRGVPQAAAIRQIVEIDSRLAQQNPHNGYDGGVIATPLVETVLGPQRTLLYTLLGAVGLVLLIACGNIANLLIARAAMRRPEIAIRGALGATRSRIVAQLLVESLVLAFAGAVAGSFVGVAGMRFLVTSPASLPRLQNTTLNLPVVLFTFALAVGCAILFGLFPAWRAARLDLQQTLRDGGRDSHGAARQRLRQALVVAELCVASLLLVGAGLLIKSSILIQSVSPGFDARNLMAFSVSLPSARYKAPAQIEAALDQIERAVAAAPGVKSVGRTQRAPMYGGGWDWTAAREGSDGHDEGAVDAEMRNASPNLFATLGVRLLRGRSFTAADLANSQPVAIISRALAERLYPGIDPLGHRISNNVSSDAPVWRAIIGVVDDMHGDGLTQDPPKTLYIPSTQWVVPDQTYLVRGALSARTVVPAIRRAVGGVDPLLALSGVSTMDDAIASSLATTRFTTWLLTLLGLTGLLLAAVGVYGVIAYVVTQRTHEFGVRIALGATGPAVRWMVVREGMVIGVIGVVLGLTASYFAARLLGAMLYGMTSRDPQTFAAAAIVLLAVGLAASYFPARRATRIDPLEALRST
ncbi:MAG TPA: ABC transporter permease [Gemmatimonadaceae bacterium]|nr:ABC transporter permease [Gemmatimonadaceae bacterium]